MADYIADTEGLVTLGIVGLILYLLYKANQGAGTFFDNLFGLNNTQSTDPTKANYKVPYSSAAATVATNPVSSTIAALGGMQGSPSSSNWNPDYVIPGTGQTAGQLTALGYSDADIGNLILEAKQQGLLVPATGGTTPASTSSSLPVPSVPAALNGNAPVCVDIITGSTYTC
jgi:hypothetical protein